MSVKVKSGASLNLSDGNRVGEKQLWSGYIWSVTRTLNWSEILMYAMWDGRDWVVKEKSKLGGLSH